MATIFSTKFFRLLQTMELAELKAFECWLQSPWCNSNKNLIRLLDRLKPYYPAFSDQKLLLQGIKSPNLLVLSVKMCFV